METTLALPINRDGKLVTLGIAGRQSSVSPSRVKVVFVAVDVTAATRTDTGETAELPDATEGPIAVDREFRLEMN